MKIEIKISFDELDGEVKLEGCSVNTLEEAIAFLNEKAVIPTPEVTSTPEITPEFTPATEAPAETPAA